MAILQLCGCFRGQKGFVIEKTLRTELLVSGFWLLVKKRLPGNKTTGNYKQLVSLYQKRVMIHMSNLNIRKDDGEPKMLQLGKKRQAE